MTLWPRAAPVNTSPELGTRTFNLQFCGSLFAAKLAPTFAASDNMKTSFVSWRTKEAKRLLAPTLTGTKRCFFTK